MNIAIRKPDVSRRAVLAGLGGMSFCIAFGVDGARLISAAEVNTATDPKSFNAWVSVAPNGSITIRSAGAEMGQGSMTSLPMIVAEEMDADWSKVQIETAPPDRNIYGYTFNNQREMAIVGSRAVQLYYNDLRMAGAQVRKIMLMNAANQWNVDIATLRTEPSVVIGPDGRRLSYGEIAASGMVPSPLPEVAASELKAKKDFRLIGHGVPRRDVPAKVNGSAIYGIDVRLPRMVYATTLHAPVHTGEPESWNDADIKKMPGVLATVRLPNGIAVVAERFEQAMAARNALQANWKNGRANRYDSETALASYVKVHDAADAQVTTLEKKGDVNAAFAAAAKTYKSEFRSDYGYHAQMEPMNAVVRISDAGDKAEVWVGTQSPDGARDAVAKTLGLRPEQVTLNQCYMGGGFGRRSHDDAPVESALIAKEVRRPVKLVWTREEDIGHGRFRPQSFQCIEAAQDASGKVTGWKHCVVGDGGVLLHTGIRIPYYDIPTQDIERRSVSHGVQVFYWRAVGHVFNVFAIESMVDEMASDAGMDPIEFRIQRMAATPKLRKCLETVAQMCDWKAPRPEGRALGLSLTDRSNSLGAGVVEISLDRSSGKIKVHKVWLAVDGGTIVTPGPARANVESAIIYGLSGVLHERITLKEGVVQQSNFHDYDLMRMSDVPQEVQVAFVETDTRPTGLGEIGNPFIGAAISNAFYRLTGKRLRHMPFTPERVLETLKA